MRPTAANRFVQVETVTMCRAYLLHQKAVEHHRTPKRKRNYRVRNRGHVLECGSVLPLLSALVGLRSKTSPNTNPRAMTTKERESTAPSATEGPPKAQRHLIFSQLRALNKNLHGFSDFVRNSGLGRDKLWCKPGEQTDQIMRDQDLSVAMFA